MEPLQVSCDYFKSSQNILLIPNREFGNRKFIHIGETTHSENLEQKPDIKEKRKSGPKLESKISSTFTRWLSAHKDRAMPNNKSLNKQWIHPPDLLLYSNVTYNVKFFGEVEVSEPKGTRIVREAVRKMKFNYQLKKSEGEKLQKVDIVVSVDSVKIQDPKTKVITHQYPLHRISYCADEKADSRVFTFIAKNSESSKHFCYGFDSDKCSQDITLTVGQAFDLAYRRYLDNPGKDVDLKKQLLLLQKQVNTLQTENNLLKSRICDLEQLKDPGEVGRYKQQNHIKDLTSTELTNNNTIMNQSDNTTVSALNNEILSSRSVVGRKLENLVFDEQSSPVYSKVIPPQVTQDNNNTPMLSPPPNSCKPRSGKSASNGVYSPIGSQSSTDDILGVSRTVDAFGMEAFAPPSHDLDQAFSHIDREYSDMQTGFSEGLSFGTEDFNLVDLDPLNSQ